MGLAAICLAWLIMFSREEAIAGLFAVASSSSAQDR
jgi:hypothetical protein